jgi:hypothetical protein
MEFVLSTEALEALLKKNPKAMAPSVAKSLLASMAPAAIARVLLNNPDEVLTLLAGRLCKDPKGTLQALQALQAQHDNGARPPAGAVVKSGKPGKSGKSGKARAKRTRTSAAELTTLQGQVVAYLKRHASSSRKDICGAVTFPSPLVYLRVMHLLVKAKKVKASGARRLRTYSAR